VNAAKVGVVGEILNGRLEFGGLNLRLRLCLIPLTSFMVSMVNHEGGKENYSGAGRAG